MAEALAVDTWQGRGIRLSEVVSALAELRHQSSDRSATRTAVMTLVSVASNDEQAYEATTALHALGGHHPARILLIRPDPDGVATLDARAILYSAESDGHEVNYEEINLDVGGQAAHHLESLVEAFSLADLPVTLWYPSSVPDPTESLLSVADAVIVDSRDKGDTPVLRDLLELSRRHTVVDLSWIRLQPWRELLSGLFDAPAYRPFLAGVTRAEVKGKSGPRRLLGGWLSAQLHLEPSKVSLVDARHAEMTVECHLDGEVGTFDVGRIDGRRAVWAGATVSTGPSLRQMLSLSEDPLSMSLSEALTHLDPDPVWERALSAATALVT